MLDIELISQIDIDHWTVRFLDGQWKDRQGDYKIVHPNLKAGQKYKVKVVFNPRRPEPTMTGYCGRLEIQ